MLAIRASHPHGRVQFPPAPSPHQRPCGNAMLPHLTLDYTDAGVVETAYTAGCHPAAPRTTQRLLPLLQEFGSGLRVRVPSPAPPRPQIALLDTPQPLRPQSPCVCAPPTPRQRGERLLNALYCRSACPSLSLCPPAEMRLLLPQPRRLSADPSSRRYVHRIAAICRAVVGLHGGHPG